MGFFVSNIMTKRFDELIYEITRRGMLGGLVGSILPSTSKANYSEEDFLHRLETLVSFIETGIRPKEVESISRDSNINPKQLHLNRFKNAYSIAYGNVDMGNDIYKYSYWGLDEKYSGAKGKYQIIPKTFKDLERMGLYNIVPQSKSNFSPTTQDKIYFFMRSKKENVKNAIKYFVNGDVDSAIYYLSREWASIPKDKSNASYYAGDKINSALMDYDQVKQFLLGNLGISQLVKLKSKK